jgi:hypothetical protein
MPAWTWTTKDGRSVAHDKDGVAQAIVYRDRPGSYNVQRAVTWPGGARDWRTLAAHIRRLDDAKRVAERG